MRHVQLEFILVHFTARSPTLAADQIGRIASLARAADATVEQLLGTLVLIHRGAHAPSQGFDRQGLANRILELVPDSHIVHGHAPGSCGDFGGDQQLFHGVTFLGCQFALARVLELPPGTVEDFTM